MDWHHWIEELGDGPAQGDSHVEVTGPTALILAPTAKNNLDDELSRTIDRLTEIAEGSS